ncbi:DUF1372 family protein [Streptococcus agalactiae]|uniref:DUF1372 family protein n=1 Tax=Streptococcus agalactiae TaxID=1311 RepID=UPI00085BB6A3|nr:DUF1372 family protein [Streptococcus agalactiae]
MGDLRDRIFYTSLCAICLIIGIVLGNVAPLNQTKKPSIIIYQVDNTGGNLIGTVTEKSIVDGHYTVTIGAYGKFLVTKEQYDSINIGDDAPDYLTGRGS